MKKTSTKIALSFFLSFTVLMTVIIIDTNNAVPEKISLRQGDVFSCQLSSFVQTGINQTQSHLAVSGNENSKMVTEVGGNLAVNTQNPGVFDFDLSLFGIVPIKSVSVEVQKPLELAVGGNLIGLRMDTDGVAVVGLSYVIGENNQRSTPLENAGLAVGDRILKMNGEDVHNIDELEDIVAESEGNSISVEYVRENQTLTASIQPAKSADGTYKIGAWVRDSTAGIGTMTFYNPDNNTFGALGHAITDVDTGMPIQISDGNVLHCTINSVSKSERGTPGEIHGGLDRGYVMGKIYGNCESGIFGTMENAPEGSANMILPVASKFSVSTGPATILCSLDGTTVKEYEINIEKTNTNSNSAKGLVIEITDSELLNETGGIVQGMSGSPIIQNGRLVGAVTHVFINNPTKGYGIFIENMLDDCSKVCSVN